MSYNTVQSTQLAWYIKLHKDRKSLDLDVIKAFVNNGANPLVKAQSDGRNLFRIASDNNWSTQQWLELIEICKSGKVNAAQYSDGLAWYLKYHKDRKSLDLYVIKAFVNNGANPLVKAQSDGRNLFRIASDNNWSVSSWLEINKIINLYENCIKVKLPPSASIATTYIQGFDKEFQKLSKVVERLKQLTDNPYRSADQDYEEACDAGEKLRERLAKHRDDYRNKTITIDEFRIRCGTDVKAALETDFAKPRPFYRAIVSILNFIAALTIVVPVVTKITTGRWGLFTNSETIGEKHLRKLADNLRGLTESENDLPVPTAQLS